MKLDPHERAIVIECVEQMLERLSAYGTTAASALLRDIFGPNSLERAAMKTVDLPSVPSNAGRADSLSANDPIAPASTGRLSGACETIVPLEGLSIADSRQA